MLEYYQLYLNELETVPALYAYPEKEGPVLCILTAEIFQSGKVN